VAALYEQPRLRELYPSLSHGWVHFSASPDRHRPPEFPTVFRDSVGFRVVNLSIDGERIEDLTLAVVQTPAEAASEVVAHLPEW